MTTTLLVFMFLAAWEWAGQAQVFGPGSLAAPSQVAAEFPRVVSTSAFRTDVTVTVTNIAIAFLVALTIGLALGWTMWRFRPAELAFEPYLAALAGFPAIVFYPVLVGVFGLSNLPLVAVGAFLALVPLSLTTLSALKQVPDVLLRLSYSLRMSTPKRYRSVIIPSALPHFIPGLRLGVLFAIIGVISSQFILGTQGLGFRISELYERFIMKDMYTYVVMVVGIAIVAHLALRALESVVRKDLT